MHIMLASYGGLLHRDNAGTLDKAEAVTRARVELNAVNAWARP